MISHLNFRMACAITPPSWEDLCLRYVPLMLERGGNWHFPLLPKALKQMELLQPGAGDAAFSLLAALVVGVEWREAPERQREVKFLQRAKSNARGRKEAPIIKANLDGFNHIAIKNFQSSMIFGYTEYLGRKSISRRDWEPLFRYLYKILETRPDPESNSDIELMLYKSIHERYRRYKLKQPSEQLRAIERFTTLHATLQSYKPA